MEALLKLLSEQSGLVLIVFGALVVGAAWAPFSLTLRNFTLANPGRRAAKFVLTALGTVVFGVGLYWTFETAAGGPIWRPTLVEYLSYVSLQGDQSECAAKKCKLQYFTSGEFRTPWFTEARYVGRIKTAGRIERFRSVPPYDTLNPEQFPRNPTYLEFAIGPRDKGGRVLYAQAELTVLGTIGPDHGKVGVHLPYQTRKATMIVDFRTLGFKITRQISARIESVGNGGVQRTGWIDPVRWDFAEGLVISVIARDIPANSSFVLVWGAD